MQFRQRSPVSAAKGILAPIVALCLALGADGALHFHRGEFSDCWRGHLPAAPTVHAPPALDAALAHFAATCTGPEGVEDCAPYQLATTLADDFPTFEANREELERRWLADLAAGHHVAAYGLGWLGSERALPDLRRLLLAERYFYGWETSSPDAPDVLYADQQFPHHLALAAAIEHITQLPLREAVKLTRAERRVLRLDARGCDGAAARWLLYKLDHEPLPNQASIAAWRRACE